MMQDRRLKIANAFIHGLAVVAFVLILSTRVPPLGRFLTDQRLSFNRSSAGGDLTDMAGITFFLSEKKLTPIRNDTNLEDAQIIVFGDSFTRQSTGEGTFHMRMENALHVPVNWQFHESGLYRNPVQMLQDKSPNALRANLLIWINVEARIGGKLFDPDNRSLFRPPGRTIDAPTENGAAFTGFSKAFSLNDVLFDNSKLEYVIKKSFLTRWLYQAVANGRFLTFQNTSSLTPKYSLMPKMLFYSYYIEMSNDPLEARGLDKTVSYLSKIDRILKDKYGLKLVFIPVPTKEAIYHDLMGPDPQYNDFVPVLSQRLEEKGITCINLYPEFMSHRQELLYWPDDTHWNDRGVQLAVETTVDFLKSHDLVQSPAEPLVATSVEK